MANDRLYLRCNKCGDSILLFKHYTSGGGPLAGYVYHEREVLQTWFDRHLYDVDRCGLGFEFDLPADAFSVYTENAGLPLYDPETREL